jgi:hypothetical protein
MNPGATPPPAAEADPKLICTHCPLVVLADAKPCAFRDAALMVRHELLRFKLGDQNRTMAILILSLSWDEGIAAVRIPKLDVFEQLTGLSSNHISETLDELTMQRVLQVTTTPDGKLYSINPNSGTWQATPRKPRATMLENLNLVREINGVSRQTEAQLNFKFEAITHFFAVKHPESGVLPKQ